MRAVQDARSWDTLRRRPETGHRRVRLRVVSEENDRSPSAHGPTAGTTSPTAASSMTVRIGSPLRIRSRMRTGPAKVRSSSGGRRATVRSAGMVPERGPRPEGDRPYEQRAVEGRLRDPRRPPDGERWRSFIRGRISERRGSDDLVDRRRAGGVYELRDEGPAVDADRVATHRRHLASHRRTDPSDGACRPSGPAVAGPGRAAGAAPKELTHAPRCARRWQGAMKGVARVAGRSGDGGYELV